jgi:hypothetical protein
MLRTMMIRAGVQTPALLFSGVPSAIGIRAVESRLPAVFGVALRRGLSE